MAREGFEALMSGQGHVAAGSAKNKAQVAASRVMPETAMPTLLTGCSLAHQPMSLVSWAWVRPICFAVTPGICLRRQHS